MSIISTAHTLYKEVKQMTIFLIAIGFIIGLAVGVYLGGEIIDERNRELKYLRKELAKANDKIVKEWWQV